MKSLLLILLYSFFSPYVFGQLEVSTGYAVNKHLAGGAPVQIAYDLKIKNRLYTKPQLGYKYLYHFNDFTDATLKVNILEFHQTFSYEIIKNKKYILKPNIGLNYRFYFIKAEMAPPYNTLPQRAWILDLFRDQKRIRLNSYDGDGTRMDERTVHNLGYSFQIQNQFYLNKKLWLHITPFVEPDYDGSQNNGGCYVGLIFKSLGGK